MGFFYRISLILACKGLIKTAHLIKAILVLAVLVLNSTCVAAEIKQYSISGNPASDLRLEVCFSGKTPYLVTIRENLHTIEFVIYKDSFPVAGLVRPKTGHYIFAKASLRDNSHEDIIAIGIKGPFRELADIFILGLDDENDIAPLRIVNTARHSRLLSSKLYLDGKKLLIPYQSDPWREISIAWNKNKQLFLLRD